MREITTGELSKILKEHKRWIDTDEKEGQCADLSNADLQGANFFGANLSGAKMHGANLSGSDLHGANLSSTDLHGTDLSAADLQGADFFRADLRGANLSGTNLSGASMYGTQMHGADQSGACLEGVKGLNYDKVTTYSEKGIKDSFLQNDVSCLWHLTHKDNLQSILEHGILNHDDAHGLLVKPVDISDHGAQRWREIPEPCYHRRIHEYASLYINPRNPMLFSRRDEQSKLCLIEVSLSVIFESEYLITDGNAASRTTDFFHSVDYINELPWDVLNSKFWADHNDGKRKKCAEVLIYPKVMPTHIGTVHCCSGATLNALADCGRKVKQSHNLFF
ncbi:MAG: DUF4433 domain-containing protein [Candidatus Scalindua sp.]|jgi:hypothetical protein|nr:DUF4433 domain-containing protein [Candidatus Scalindua sp.]